MAQELNALLLLQALTLLVLLTLGISSAPNFLSITKRTLMYSNSLRQAALVTAETR